MQARKQAVREEIHRRLAATTDVQRADWSARIAVGVFASPAWGEARVVMAFMSLPREVQTRGLIERAWAEGKRVAVPRVDWPRREMAAVLVRSWEDEFVHVRRGLVQPADAAPVVPVEQIDLVLTPGLAFDAGGGRLGRGGGYFDRFLAQPGFRGVTCGLAFDCQRVEQLPREATDLGVDLLVTQSGTFAF